MTLSNSNSKSSKTSIFLNTFNQKSLTFKNFTLQTLTCSDLVASY